MIQPVESLAEKLPYLRCLVSGAVTLCPMRLRVRAALSFSNQLHGVASLSSTDMLHDYGAHFSSEILSPTSRYRRTIRLNGEPSWMT